MYVSFLFVFWVRSLLFGGQKAAGCRLKKLERSFIFSVVFYVARVRCCHEAEVLQVINTCQSETDTQPERHRETNRQTGSQTDRRKEAASKTQTGWQTGSQTDRKRQAAPCFPPPAPTGEATCADLRGGVRYTTAGLSDQVMRGENGRRGKSFSAQELRGWWSRWSLSAASRTPTGHHQGDCWT